MQCLLELEFVRQAVIINLNLNLLLFHAPLNSVSGPTLGMVGRATIVRGVVIIRGVGILSQFLSLREL